MDKSQKSKTSWWQTLPGVLSAVAATATAIAGLIGALHQAGLFANSSSKGTITMPSETVQPKVSLIGSWAGSADCTIVFYKDDGINVEGSCDKAGYNHKVVGTYDEHNHNNISTTITRTDPKGCTTSVSGYIKLIDSDRVEYGQNGWNDCGVTSGSGKQLLSRL